MKSAVIVATTRGALIIFAIALPWLNPFASGPSPAVLPWLLTVATAGLILLGSLYEVWVVPYGRTTFTQRWAYPAAWAWALVGVVSSVIGLLQYFGAAQALAPWVNQASFGEALANLRQRNQFATLTNISLAALLWLIATTGSFAGRGRWLMLVVAGLLAVGNAASSSRTGLLQLGLLCALVGVWGGWRQSMLRPVLLVAVGTYALAALALPWLAGLDLSEQGMLARLHAGDRLCSSRLTLWSNVLHLIAQKPWLGWGWGELDYAHYITLYDGPRFCEILDNAHNLPLHLAVELGVPAALLLCGGFVWWVLRQQPWRETDVTRQLAWSVLALIGVHSLLEYPLWYGPFQMAAGLCVLLLWRGAGVEAPPKYQANKLPAQVVRSLSAIVLIAFTACVAWDYHRISQIYLAPEARDEAYRDDTLIKIRDSWLFRNQVQFAELSLTPLTRGNAQWTFDTATALLHYSPEPRVIEKVIESAVLLGRDDEALAYLVRYRAAFPADHARWAQANARLPGHLQRLN